MDMKNNKDKSCCDQLVVRTDHQNHYTDDDDDDDDHSVFVQQRKEEENHKEPIWEEEATPSQTQFGKMLLFQRPMFKKNPNDDDDLLSTTSEHGSVISMAMEQQPQDVASVNDLSIHRTQKSPSEIEDDVLLQHPLAAATVDTSTSTHYQTPSQDISNNDDDNDIDKNTNVVRGDDDRIKERKIAATSMDDDTTISNEQPQPQQQPQQDLVETQSSLLCYSKSMIEEAEVMDEIEEEAILSTTTSKSNFDNEGQQPDLPMYGSVKSTTDFLFTKNNNVLIKRLIGGVSSSSSKGSSNPQQRYPISQSAPTTPRASTTWYTSTTTTPSAKNNPVITTTPHTPSNTATTKNRTAAATSTALPSSFLLRSPGSIAFQSASKSRDNQTRDNSHSTYSSWFIGGSKRTIVDRKVNEVTTDDDGNVVGVDSHDLVRNNKELLQQHFPNTAMISTTTKTNPFHLVARSCFSFDAAYDTSIDDQYEFSLPTATTIADNDDTADNDDETAPSTCFQYTTSGMDTTATSNSLDEHVQRHLPIPELNHPTISSQGKTLKQPPFPSMSSTNSSSIFKRPIAGTHHVIGYSASWDVSTTATSTATSGSPIKRYNPKSTLFQSQQQQRSDYRRLFRQNPTRWGINTGSNKNVKTNYPPSVSTLTTGLSSSPTKPIRNVNNTYSGTENTVQQLKSPQRIEIERDDAIDILACLVERGVSWKQQDQTHSNSLNEPLPSIKNNNLYPIADPNNSIKQCSSGLGFDDEDDDNAPSPADIAAIVEELQGLSLAEENLGNYSTNNTAAHEKRKLALEELLRSHEYALEMKRASKSASSWLQSIGRSQSSSPTKKMSVTGSPARNVILSESTTPSTSPYREEDMQATMETTASTRAYNSCQIQAAGEESSASDNMDLLTAKAMLHSAQIEAKEKSDLAERLNEELAKCRAEIGRLKSSAQSMSFRSPNRSILDESDDEVVEDETNGTDEKKYDDMKVVGDPQTDRTSLFGSDRIVDDENNCLDSSFLPEDAPGDGIDKDLELERYKAALKEANTNIRNLYSSLLQHSNEYDVGNVPIVTVSSNERVIVTQEEPGHSDRQSYTVEPTDMNNFTTEWNDLSPPLTNPPDHDLKSPIVRAVLELWTDDLSLQESLMNWVDQVLDGDDPDSIPPLTLSNLDHQARDGFVFHILPLLLRRPDVLLDVKTRTCRRTSYDLNVFVDRVTDDLSQVRLDSCTQVDGEQPLRFDPVLTPSSNGIRNMEYSDYGTPRSIDEKVPAMSRLSYDEVAEDLALSDTSQPGFMSTLGGALGGLLLSRSRKSLSSDHIAPSLSIRRSMMNGTNMNMPTIIESPHTVSSSSDAHAHDDVVRFVEMDHDDLRGSTSDQPYHRVVSAPSGRIGVTFIDYRGHCMVSDVYHDSPLVGWIFPSDVLIAIDDIPVAGSPIRDIIKLLKDRSNNPQRALRVISSHAMNALTLNASAIMNDVTG